MEVNEINNELSQKQKYLREEIMEKQYNIDEFSEYISKSKENGLELNNWTFDELKEAVQNYKNQKEEEKNKEEEEEKMKENIEKEEENKIRTSSGSQIEYPNLEPIKIKDSTALNINYDYNVINFDNIPNHNNNNKKSIPETGKKSEIQKKVEIEKDEKNCKDENLINKSEENKNGKEEKELSDFEIIDENNIDKYESEREIIKCEKQQENYLTNNNNLEVNLVS